MRRILSILDDLLTSPFQLYPCRGASVLAFLPHVKYRPSAVSFWHSAVKWRILWEIGWRGEAGGGWEEVGSGCAFPLEVGRTSKGTYLLCNSSSGVIVVECMSKISCQILRRRVQVWTRILRGMCWSIVQAYRCQKTLCRRLHSTSSTVWIWHGPIQCTLYVSTVPNAQFASPQI